MRVLLTGSEGRIATRVLKPGLSPVHELAPFDLTLGDDMLDPEKVERRMPGIDAVIHTAGIPGPLGAEDPDAFDRVNVGGSRLLIESAKRAGVRRFVFFSSFARYGVDSWMRHRDETGPISGDGVAVPRWLPLDESHPSILEYEGLEEWGGKWYGESKARVEEIGEAAADDSFAFVSLRLSGVRERTRKWVARRQTLLEESGRGLAQQRKQWVYGAAGAASASLLVSTLLAVLEADLRGFEAFNVTDATHSNESIVRAYFPENEVTDQIFATQKLRVFLNRAGYPYVPPAEPGAAAPEPSRLARWIAP